MYNVFDFKAVSKHSYYGARGTFDTVICPETGDKIIGWQAGVNDFLTRYMDNLPDTRTLIVAHDKGREYRTAFFPEYKDKSKKKPMNPTEAAEIKKMEEWLKTFFAALGVLQIGVEGVEADDVIAWICAGQELPVMVHTVDADLLQLVSDTVAVNLKGEIYFEGMEYKDLPTDITSVMKSIVGDPSDNYKGIPGMGPAAFQKLFDLLGHEGIRNLETIISEQDVEALETLSETNDSKELLKLRDNWATWIDQYRLARLHPELCHRPRARKLIKPILHKRIPNAQKVYDLLKQIGAQDLWKDKYSKMVPGILAVDNAVWQKSKSQIIESMKESEMIAFDYESTDKNQIAAFREASTVNFVDVLSQEISGVSFCFGEHLQNVIYITVDHKDADNVPISELKELFQFLQEEKSGNLIAHNAFFEGVLTKKDLGVQLDGVKDTRIMQRYYDENSPAGLKSMSSQYLNYSQDDYEYTLKLASAQNFAAVTEYSVADILSEDLDLTEEEIKLKESVKCTAMNQLTLQQVLKYGADDSLVTAHLADLMIFLLKLDQQWTHYEKWCVDPTVVLQSAYIKGVNINWALQKRLHSQDVKIIETKMSELRNILEENVTGGVTEGCLSYISEEQQYMERSHKDKDPEGWFPKVEEWKAKLKEACIYKPYSEVSVMPNFAFTANQLTKAAEAIGLPPIEKVTMKFFSEYFEALGVTKAEPKEYEGDQKEFIEVLTSAVTKRVDRLKAEETFERRQAFDKLAEVTQRLAGVKPRVVKLGDELNVGSPSQMKELLYCKIGVPVRLYGTSVGLGRLKLGIKQAGPSTDEKAIQTALAMDAEIPWVKKALEALLKIKSASTRISLFHAKMPMWKHLDGRIHPFITDSGTDTRRPTGSAPNILQIPSKGEGREMRSMYMPPNPDYVCVAIDFSGQELRITACESGDPKMLEAYAEGNEKDIHSMTGTGIAAKMAESDHKLAPLAEFFEFDKARKDENHPLHEEANTIREKKAKGVNFGLTYGAAAPTVSRNLIIPLQEAEFLLDGAFATYSRLKPWQEETARFMNTHGYTITAFGTKRHAPDDLFSGDRGKVSRIHRQGTNFTIQGTAAEMLKIILTRLHQEGWLEKLRMDFFAPIYDEIVSWVHKDDVVEYCEAMYNLMSEATPPGHTVPQIPEFSIGPDWGNLHELGRKPSEESILKLVQQALEEGKEVWQTDMLLSYEEVYS